MATLSTRVKKLARSLPYNFQNPNKLEEALLLPDHSDDQRHDGNRKMLAVGRQVLTLVTIMKTTQYNSRIRKDVQGEMDGVAARKRRAQAAKLFQLDRTLQRSPRQREQTLSDKTLERVIFALVGVVCVDSGANLGAVTNVYTFLMSPTALSLGSPISPMQTAALPAPRPASRDPSGMVTSGMFNTLLRYSARESKLCKEHGLEHPDVLSTPAQRQSDQAYERGLWTDVNKRYLFFALGSQERMHDFADEMVEFRGFAQDYWNCGMNWRSCLDVIRSLDDKSGANLLLKHFLVYRFYHLLDEHLREPFDPFILVDGPDTSKRTEAPQAGNPRRRQISLAREYISQQLASHGLNTHEREELVELSNHALKLGANLDVMVTKWGLGALAFLEGDEKNNRRSKFHLKVTEKMIHDLGNDTFRLIVNELHTKAGETFIGISRFIKPRLEQMLRGEAIGLRVDLGTLKTRLLSTPRFLIFAELAIFFDTADRLEASLD